MNAPGTQTLRLRRPDNAAATPKAAKHTGILQDQLRRTARPPWCPSLSVAFRILLLIRVAAATYSNIQDCDEVFNFWEPLHYLIKGNGFQTWEVSPEFAIRSWAYISLHFIPAWAPVRLLRLEKRQSFFALRMFFALVCSFCEAKFYRAVVERVNIRVGRYLLFMLLCSAGMWNASTAFLPSTFAMYSTMLAFSYALEPPSASTGKRTLCATFFFALGAIVGWPFALLLAVPFVFEELFIFGADRVQNMTTWLMKRWQRLFTSGAVAALIFVPVIAIDTLAYGRTAIVPWNIVKYNIFSGSERGPELYGTEPWYFYFLNLLLNFNLLLPLALASVPALFITYFIDRRRLGGPVVSGPEQSSPFTVLALRLAPLYLWFGVLTAQPHKEERFMYPAYPLLCFNAATTIYLIRGWMEVTYVKATKSPYAASRTSLFSITTLSLVSAACVISISRILALSKYYHAPLDVAFHFQNVELPRLLNVTGLLPERVRTGGKYDDDVPVDLTAVKQFGLRLCTGKEWYRFPGHFLVPDGIQVDFVKSEFDGLLPKHFEPSSGAQHLWKRDGTRIVPKGFNDVNKEEMDRYVDVADCDYLVDLDFPQHPSTTTQEPRYAVDPSWDRVTCAPFLDASYSTLLTRTLWLPGEAWRQRNSFGDYCVLRNKKRASERESRSWKS